MNYKEYCIERQREDRLNEQDFTLRMVVWDSPEMNWVQTIYLCATDDIGDLIRSLMDEFPNSYVELQRI